MNAIKMLPCKHKDRKNIYSDFQLRANMDVKQNLVTNTIISCPLRDRCNCQFQAKIIETSVQTILFIADLHTAAENVSSKDRSNSLKHSQRHMIASAVKVAHIQSPGKLIRNIRNSPTKEIDPALRKSAVTGSCVLFARRDARSVLYRSKELLWTIQSAAWQNWPMIYGLAML